MNISTIVFFDMAAAILILALGLVVIVFYLSKVTKTLHANLNMKDEAMQKNADLLDEARTKAMKILDDANNKALDIVSKANLSVDIASDNFKQEVFRNSSAQIKEFEKTTSDFSKLYSQNLQDLKIKNIEVFQNVSKEIEINAVEEIKNFKESMQKLTTASQKEVKEKMDSEYQSSKEEIENYKKEELEKINSSIYDVLEKTAKLVLGKAISLSDHEELITKALEKAKKEGTFNN